MGGRGKGEVTRKTVEKRSRERGKGSYICSTPQR